MRATQSHSIRFHGIPATRHAWTGHLTDVAARTGGFIGCLFTAVIVGIVDAAMAAATQRLARGVEGAFERVEWIRCRQEAWTIQQCFEGMLRAAETQHDSRLEVLQGKTVIAELAETLLTRVCRVMGGSTFARHAPFGFWFEDVRALGFLRPPWNLAYATLIDGLMPGGN